MGLSSMGWLLQALGLKMVIVEDAETMQRMAHRLVKRQEKNVRRAALPSDPVASV